MTADDFVRSLAGLAQLAASEGHGVGRTLAAEQMANAHQRAFKGSVVMAIRDMHRRLDHLPGGGRFDLAAALQAARGKHEARQAAWLAAGNSGNVPFAPIELPPENATRREQETWRKIANGQARVLFLRRDDEVSLAKLQTLYAMSDADLAQALNQHAWSAPA